MGIVTGVEVTTVVDADCIGVGSEQHIIKKHISANAPDINNGLYLHEVIKENKGQTH